MIYLSGILLAFFLSFVLLTKRQKVAADYILICWLGIVGVHLLGYYLTYTGQTGRYPTLVGLTVPLPLVHGPFLYLYTRMQTSSEPFHKRQLLHFLPLLLSYAMFWRFFTLPLEQQAAVFIHRGQGFEIQSIINLVALSISGLVYITLSILRLVSYRRNLVNEFSNTERINFNWLLYLIGWMLAIWMIILMHGRDELIFGAAALFVLWLGYFGIKQVQVFSQPALIPDRNGPKAPDFDFSQTSNNDPLNLPPQSEGASKEAVNTKYQKSGLDEQDASMIHNRLMSLMDERKPYTNPDLTLSELAGYLEVHPNALSQVINSRENRNFYELVNARRIEEFISRISEPASQQYTLLGVAYDCGFNSKASFNRNFKKHTGLTPSDYVKQRPA
jgi:AraC-like DNA-binding protein